MDLRRYVRLFRERWALILVSTVVCTGAAALLAETRAQMYVAHSQMFVSATGGATLGDTYEGGLFVQQRVASYTHILSSAAVVKRVIDQLRLPDTVAHLQSEISASVPAGTVLIDVAVNDRSPTRAHAIADALDAQFAEYVASVETPQANGQPPVKISAVSPAQTSPASSRTTLDIGVGLLLGLVLGAIAAVTLESLDDRISEEKDLESIIGAPVLCTIVHGRDAPRGQADTLAAPGSTEAEAFRRLRASLHAVSEDGPPGSLAITSALPAEGKTFVATNLGIAFAQAGHRVVLVNADTRGRSLAHITGARTTRGLTDVLARNARLDSALHVHPSLPFELLDSGPAPEDAGEIFESRRFVELLATLGTRADIVLVDAPALLAEADAAVVADAVSGVILVVRGGSTRKSELENAARALRMVDTPVVGVVLNVASRKGIRRYVRPSDDARGASATRREPSDGVPPHRTAEHPESRAGKLADRSPGHVG